MRAWWWMLPGWLTGCGTYGLESYGDSGEGGDAVDLIAITPTGPVSFGNVSPYADPAPTNTLTVAPAEGVDKVFIHAVGRTDTSSQAFSVEAPDDLFPLALTTGRTFDIAVAFPSEDYQGRDNSGSFTGQIFVTVSETAGSAQADVTKTITGSLCVDRSQDGTCG